MPKPQGGHRLGVIAHHNDESLRQLLDQGYHASDRCYDPKCVNPEHICVEPKSSKVVKTTSQIMEVKPA